MQVYQNKKILKYFSYVLISITLAISFSNIIYPSIGHAVEGGGGDTGGGDASCVDNALTDLCGDPPGSKGGGASWRIFRTDNGWGLDDYTGYGADILQKSYKLEAISACKSSGWFASFGWDGMAGSYYGYTNYNFQIGPANRNGLIGEAVYNSYDAKNYEEIVKNNFPNNAKITAGAALQLYKAAINSQATNIPIGTGYFCIDANEIMQKTLSGISVDTNGKEIGNNPNSKTVNNGNKATITAKDITDYEFLGWSESKTGIPSGGKDYTVQSLTQDKTVYAIYHIKEITIIPEDPTVKDDPDAEYRTISNGGTIWTRPKLEKTVTFNYSIYYSCINGISWSTDLITPNRSMIKQDQQLNGQLASDKNCNGLSAAASQSVALIADNNDVGTSTEFSKKINVTTADDNVSVKTKSAVSSVVVKVPYNFRNSIELSSNGDGIVYAGADMKIQSSITVSPKNNSLVGGDEYATIVRNAQAKYIITQGDYTTETPITIQNGELNSSGNLSGDNKTVEQSISIQDLPAGSEVCITAAVYPASSGADDNLDANGDGNWAYSSPSCITVAKRPSFQVWGSNGLYADGDIKSNFVNKINAGENNGIYGSWAEHAIISNGNVSGVASGAAIAKNGTTSNNPICDFSMLIFANNNCASGKLGQAKINYSNNFGSSIIDNYSTDANFYNNNQVLSASELDFEIQIAQGYDITIRGNQTYRNQNYTSAESMPQRIIYAKNIYIDCAVTRIDAILVAEEKIDTCVAADGSTPDANDAARSNQLIVNGAVIAKKLLLNRTYGAGTGENSGIPAEIFNYSASIYFWAKNLPGQDDKLFSVYQREIAPRY